MKMFLRTQKFELNKPSFDFLCFFLCYSSFHRDSFCKHLLPTWSRMCSVQCSPWDECDINACFSFKTGTHFSFKMESSSIQQNLGDRRGEILNRYGIFYIFFSCQDAAPGSHLCFNNLNSQTHLSDYIATSLLTGLLLVMNGIQTGHWTLFGVILSELSLSFDPVYFSLFEILPPLLGWHCILVFPPSVRALFLNVPSPSIHYGLFLLIMCTYWAIFVA